MRTSFVLVAALVGVIIASFVAGCGGGGGGTALPDPAVRFVNVSPDSNPLDFFIDTTKDGTALTYLGGLSPEVSFKNGDKDVSVQDSITQDNLDAIAFTFNKDNKYLVLTEGLQNYGTETQKRLRLIAFQYDKNPPNGSKARLLILHTYLRSTGFDTPDIDFQGAPATSYDPNNPQYSVTDVAFGADQASTVEVDSGVSTLFEARRAGTENVLASDPGTTFDAGGIYLALVSGIEGGAGAQAPKITYIKLN